MEQFNKNHSRLNDLPAADRSIVPSLRLLIAITDTHYAKYRTVSGLKIVKRDLSRKQDSKEHASLFEQSIFEKSAHFQS